MDIPKNEARQAMDEAEQTMKTVSRKWDGDSAFPHLMLWGTIWFVYPMWIQLWPQTFYIPMFLFPLGGIASWLIAKHGPVKNANDKRTLLIGLILWFFACIWTVLLKPESPEQVYAFGCTVAMFAYVVAGFWWGRFFTVLGLAVTVLTLAGYYLLPGIFWLWMAFMGGGALMVSGLYLKFWRK